MNLFGSSNDSNSKENNDNLFDSRVKASTRLTLRELVGGYIAYLGWQLMKNGDAVQEAADTAEQAEKHAPDWLRSLAGIVFIACGIGFMVYSYIDYRRKKEAEAEAAAEAEREERLAETPDVPRVDIAECGKLTRLQEIYAQYLADVREVAANSKPSDGLLGLGSSPKDDACHTVFYQDVTKELDRLVEDGLSEGEAAAAAEYVLLAPDAHRDNELAYPMIFAASGLANKLVGLLSPKDADRLAIAYSEAIPKPERMPAQSEVLQMLYDRARG